MSNAPEPSRELQTALSFLDGVDRRIETMSGETQAQRRLDLAKKILQEDIFLANRELDKLEARGVDVSAARSSVSFKEGNVWFAVSEGAAIPLRERRQPYVNAVVCYEKSLRLAESAEAYYNLGRCYEALQQTQAAIVAYRHSEQMGSYRLKLEATESIQRLDPNGRISATLQSDSRSSCTGFIPIQTEYRFRFIPVLWGAILTLIGLASFQYALGVALLLAGIGLVVYGFANKSL